eukprot:m.1103979 g.1103979  ORF g.1103979 m.1103979 type:complete len:311 (-) comp24335_c0_seq15:83-1015(-)
MIERDSSSPHGRYVRPLCYYEDHSNMIVSLVDIDHALPWTVDTAPALPQTEENTPVPTIASTHDASRKRVGNSSIGVGISSNGVGTPPTSTPRDAQQTKRVSLAPPPSLLSISSANHGSQGSISTPSSRSSSTSSLAADAAIASPETSKNRRDRARSMFRRHSSKNGTSWEDARAAARQRSSSSLLTSPLPSDDSNSTPSEDAADSPCGLSVSDWQHIRMSLVKAELEDLRDENDGLVALILDCKACASCATKFGRFRSGKQCVICRMTCCSRCLIKFDLPPHMHAQLTGASTDPTVVCKDCKLYMGGRV